MIYSIFLHLSIYLDSQPNKHLYSRQLYISSTTHAQQASFGITAALHEDGISAMVVRCQSGNALRLEYGRQHLFCRY